MLNNLGKILDEKNIKHIKTSDFSIEIKSKKYIIEIHEVLSGKYFIKIFDINNNLIEKYKYKRISNVINVIKKYNI